MTVGSALAAAGLLLWSQIQAPWQLYPTFVLLGLAMSLVLYEAAFAVLARSFAPSPVQAMALLTMLAALGGVAFPLLTNGLVTATGWRTCLVIPAAELLVLTVLRRAALLQEALPAVRASNSPAGSADSTIRQGHRRPQLLGTDGGLCPRVIYLDGPRCPLRPLPHRNGPHPHVCRHCSRPARGNADPGPGPTCAWPSGALVGASLLAAAFAAMAERSAGVAVHADPPVRAEASGAAVIEQTY